MSFEWGIDANRRESLGQEVRRRIRRRRRSAGRSPRERVAEFFATGLSGSLLPYAIACGAKV